MEDMVLISEMKLTRILGTVEVVYQIARKENSLGEYTLGYGAVVPTS